LQVTLLNVSSSKILHEEVGNIKWQGQTHGHPFCAQKSPLEHKNEVVRRWQMLTSSKHQLKIFRASLMTTLVKSDTTWKLSKMALGLTQSVLSVQIKPWVFHTWSREFPKHKPSMSARYFARLYVEAQIVQIMELRGNSFLGYFWESI
jgi:hypothetical protein